jgi:homoserine kinase
MRERIKMFTFLSGSGATVIESPLEDKINQWLESIQGEIVEITQSESERSSVGQHVTVCIWYIPAKN